MAGYRTRKRFYTVSKLSEQQNHRCCYCYCRTWIVDKPGWIDKELYFETDKLPGMYKSHMATIDHIIPTAKGGKNHINNYVMSCYTCNNLRGATDALKFWKDIQSHVKGKLFEKKSYVKRFIKKDRKDLTDTMRYKLKAFWIAYLCLSMKIPLSQIMEKILPMINEAEKTIQIYNDAETRISKL